MARATRRLVLKRDGFRCTVCGATEPLEVHHIVPRAAGGSNDPANLVTLCLTCHSGTHERPLHSAKRAVGSPLPNSPE